MLKKILIFTIFIATISLNSAENKKDEHLKIDSKIYEQLVIINKEIQEKNFYSARKKIIAVLQTENITQSEITLTTHIYGNLYMVWEKYELAQTLFEMAIEPEILPEERQLETIKILAQLYIRDDKLEDGVDFYEKWIKQAPKDKIDFEDYLVISKIYFQLGNYQKSIDYIQETINSAEKIETEWLEIMYIANLKLANYNTASQIILSLLNKEPKNLKYWQILLSVYKEKQSFDKEFVLNDIMYRLELVKDESLTMNLINFLVAKKIPFVAGKILENAINLKIVPNTIKNNELLIYLWFNSKEYRKVEESLISAIEKFDQESMKFQLAQLYMNSEDYTKSIEVFKRLLEGKEFRGEAHLNLGIIYFYSKQFRSAKYHWRKATRYKSTNKKAKQYLQQIN